MKLNTKDYKKIIISLAVIILVIILFFFFNKSKNNKINADNKSKSSANTAELQKNDGKTTSKDQATDSSKTAASGTNADNIVSANQGKAGDTKVISSQAGVTVFVKAASFGSTSELLIDKSKFDNSYKYYQFLLGNKQISKVESIAKEETTIFPDQKAGNIVTLKLMDENMKVMKELKITLNKK